MRRITTRKDRRSSTHRKGNYWFARGRRSAIRKLLANELEIARDGGSYREFYRYIALRGGIKRARLLTNAKMVRKGVNWNHVNRVILAR